MNIIITSSLIVVSLVNSCLNTDDVPVRDEVGQCNECGKTSLVNENEISPEELKALRMEMIKDQILQKLRLKEPPSVVQPVLPELLTGGDFLTSFDEEQEYEKRFNRDDFYGTTQQVVIFPENTSTHNCYTRDVRRPNCCFRFRLTRDVTTRSVTSAELRVYKVGYDDTDIGTEDPMATAPNYTYTVTDVAPHPTGKGFIKKVVSVVETNRSPGWIKFELSPAVRTWALRRHMAHALEINCSGCDSSLETPVSVEESHKPFIVVNTDPWKVDSRHKRSLTCTPSSTHCCKERFTVTFSDINWHSWILYPPYYEANFCRGSCTTDVSASRYHHTTVLRRYISKHSRNGRNLTFALCCTPYVMKPLTLIYIDEHNNIYKTALPNMIVDSCECA